ncbi:hypothetical protein Sjap_020347 [Stephania japonica]|uniref:phosphatidate cytidylyltransferase n=1 Tax=Stephania japonica TaxID=461633 RepID=A0AAP0HVH9_9MAGN
MAVCVELDGFNFVPITRASLCCCRLRPCYKPPILSRPTLKSKPLRVAFDGVPRLPIRARENRRLYFSSANRHSHSLNSIVAEESDDIKRTGDSKEVLGVADDDSEMVERFQSVEKKRSSGSQLKKRIVFGLAIGIGVGGVVLAGGAVFTVAVAAAVFAAAREYFELVRSRGIAAGMTPPPRYVSRVCSVICALMPLLALYFGHIDVSVTSAAFIVAMALLLQRGIPRFAQLSSAMFGLFYCGYLPCFWVKLRCGLSAPALNTKIGLAWPVLFGGSAQWTVGLVATLISFSSIIAADTFAFLGGKLLYPHPSSVWEPLLNFSSHRGSDVNGLASLPHTRPMYGNLRSFIFTSRRRCETHPCSFFTTPGLRCSASLDIWSDTTY